MANVETDPEASAIVRARAAVVAGTRTGPGIGRIVGKSASNAGRSASSTGRHGRIAGKSASNAGRSASKRAAEIRAAGETKNAGEGPDSVTQIDGLR
jgi:hypothetical protein